ncbi:hypothetical protein TrRE_jg5660, partial [Triparma retinervis]
SHLEDAGYSTVLIAPQKTLDSYTKLVSPSSSILKTALIGLPDLDETNTGTYAGVIFTPEEPLITSGAVENILKWEGFKPDFLSVTCAPISEFVNKEKKGNWIPVFNNDAKEEKMWSDLIVGVRSLTYSSFSPSASGCLLRYGSLLGGGTDGPDFLKTLGLEDDAYKMSLEQYRDLRERAFDRYRLGGQVLRGDSVNRKPPLQEEREKGSGMKGEEMEAYRASGGYPEQDRTNRHTLASAVVHAVRRGVKEGEMSVGKEGRVGRECTVLSKCVQELPTEEEWGKMFDEEKEAEWPDPREFVFKGTGTKGE